MNGRPNIVWITTDQQRFDTIKAHGNEAISTPNLNNWLSRACRSCRLARNHPTANQVAVRSSRHYS